MNKPAVAPSVTPDPLIFSLLHAAHAVEKRLDDAFATVGLSLAKFSVLSQLAQAGAPMALSELAARLSCVRSNMTQLVDRLESDGLVRRVDDPADRRVVLAALTPSGAKAQVAGAQQFAAVHKEFLATFSAQDRPHSERLLSAIT